MQYNTAGEPIIFYDMCAYCSMGTGGQHQLNCPLLNEMVVFVLGRIERFCWQSEYTQENIEKHKKRGIELVPVA